MGVEVYTANSLQLAGCQRGYFTPGIIKIRLQPQMEKYRCLWCKSSPNHYILYFMRISQHSTSEHWTFDCGKLQDPRHAWVLGSKMAPKLVQIRVLSFSNPNLAAFISQA